MPEPYEHTCEDYNQQQHMTCSNHLCGPVDGTGESLSIPLRPVFASWLAGGPYRRPLVILRGADQDPAEIIGRPPKVATATSSVAQTPGPPRTLHHPHSPHRPD
jgi:hypothetical protein